MRDIHTKCYCVEGGSPLKYLMEKVLDEKLLFVFTKLGYITFVEVKRWVNMDREWSKSPAQEC